MSTSACDAPTGYVGDASDCDDGATAINPGAVEVCDEHDTDEDCDGSADDSSATGQRTWYRDADDDGFGDPDSSTPACDLPSGYASEATDCDDGARL